MTCEDAELREFAVYWYPATNRQVRAMALELLALREVAKAASACYPSDDPGGEECKLFGTLEIALAVWRALEEEP